MPFKLEPMMPDNPDYQREGFRGALVFTDENHVIVAQCDIFLISHKNTPKVAQTIKMMLECAMVDLKEEFASNEKFMKQSNQ